MSARIDLHGVDIGHSRLPELLKLADAAEPFYRWIEAVFRRELRNELSLSANLLGANAGQLAAAISRCFRPQPQDSPVPELFDGGGNPYPHRKACFYFFAWLLRDAPQQRLGPLIARATKAVEQVDQGHRDTIEIEALVALFLQYRSILDNFEWSAIREVVYDRLEGSRRSIKGHEKEVVVKTALVASVQEYYKRHGGYGVYRNVAISDGQIKLDNETFDASAMLDAGRGGQRRQLLVPVKTRETEGGGHSHIFTRDINSAILAAKRSGDNFVVAVIVAQSWSEREQEHVSSISDLAIVIQANPNEFSEMPGDAQRRLNEFVAAVLDGRIQPKGTRDVEQQIREATN